jgi:hypothetical protein
MHLFDHLVGAYQQPGRKFDPERPRRFQVEGQLDFYGLLYRQIGWFLAFEKAQQYNNIVPGVRAELIAAAKPVQTAQKQQAPDSAAATDNSHTVSTSWPAA